MRKALIVWGGWSGHEPEAGARYVGDMLRADGFEVEISNDYGVFDRDLSDLSLIIPIVTGDELDRPRQDNIEKAVRAGVGLAGYHGAIATSFPAAQRFRYLAGVLFVRHPGNIIPYRVNISRPDDPIVAGIGDFDYVSEQYYLNYDPSVEVLATTTFSGEHDPVTAGVVMPVVLKRRFEKGRIFYTALGHVVKEFENEQMRTILRRGLNWAAR